MSNTVFGRTAIDPLVSLSAASVALVGTHLALSHPLRAPLVRAMGEKAFTALYSLVAAACMVWMVLAFRSAPPADLGSPTGDIGWIVSTLLSLPALLLFLGSLWKNPALPDPRAAQHTSQTPRGVFAVTRHPMMLGVLAVGAQPSGAVVELAHHHRGACRADPRAGRRTLPGSQEGGADGRRLDRMGA